MPLRTVRRWLAERGGEASFEEFMAAALHDPAIGYYARHVRTVGRRGDFSTSATLSTLPGRAVAAWLRREAALHGGSLRGWAVIEIGPGDGTLHAAVMKSLPWWQRPRRSLLVETSPVLRAAQQKNLASRGKKSAWHTRMAEALDACGGNALIFSNELPDAFPAMLLRRTADGGWEEMRLRLTGESVTLIGSPPAVLPDSTAVQPDSGIAPGSFAEVHESFRAWQAEWAGAWRAGSMLTIDYGDLFPQVYYRRPRGTLRGYLHHQRLEGPELLQNMGRADLTADVNFSDLMRWGARHGWENAECPAQAEFFTALVPGPLNEKDARLTDPEGPGGAFRCLVQRRLAAAGASR